jgi:SPP1 gp7 family putative phage head morphogenesis protein
MRLGAHKADVRIAANNARKIQAALRQGVDAKRVIAAYRKTQPAESKNPTQDRARARSWAMLNMRINNEPLLEILQRTWADGFVLGQAYGDDEIKRAREAKKADNNDYIDWDNWKPGDAATATLLRPPKAFQELLGRARVTIKDLDQTGYDRVGTALADSIAQGLSDTRAARLINDAIGNPARALSIAITETNRAMSFGAISRYQAANLEQMEWAVSDPCPECAINSGAVVNIGSTFPSGANQPPAHPHCRCVLLPVIPEFEPNANGVVDIAPATGDPMPYELNPTKMTTSFDDRFVTLSEEQRLRAENILKETFTEAAEQPVRINLSSKSLEGVANDGRFKSVFERPTYSEYMEQRLKVETDSMGIPKSIKPIERPIYGSTSGDASMYGNVQVTLKDSVKGRTTITLGDSFVEQNPVFIRDILSGDVTRDALAQASPIRLTNFEGMSKRIIQGASDADVADFVKNYSYWEVQIHGGVSLDDILSVTFPSAPNQGIINKLKAKGIQIVIQP